jgi:flavorubredoxin
VLESIEAALAGKKVALFGSYGWGDGEWMRSWEADCAAAGIELAAESVICADAPDEEALNACRTLGSAIA